MKYETELSQSGLELSRFWYGLNDLIRPRSLSDKFRLEKLIFLTEDLLWNRKMCLTNGWLLILFLFYKLRQKKTDKQKERWQEHRNSCGQLQRARILIKKNYYKSALAVSYGLRRPTFVQVYLFKM